MDFAIGFGIGFLVCFMLQMASVVGYLCRRESRAGGYPGNAPPLKPGQRIIPPKGGSGTAPPKVGPKGGTGVPPKPQPVLTVIHKFEDQP